jgi:Rrf2 family transcriptional regulator, iron-sulfur cluster assembly transcription factor
MQLTRAADYATRVMVHLAGLPPGSRASLPELAAAVEVPDHFLSKVLQALGRNGLIQSQRGASGGFVLSADPERISLLDVVEAIEGPIRLNLCLGPGEGCTRISRCPVHLVWANAQDALVGVLRSASIAGLARQAGEIA